MKTQDWINQQKIEPVQDRKDGKNYWETDNLYTEADLIEMLEAFIDIAESKLEKEEEWKELVVQELHNLGMPTHTAINQAAFESEYGYSSTNYNSFKEGVKWIIEQFELFNKTFNTKER